MNNNTISKLLGRFKHTDLNIVIDKWSALKARKINKSCFSSVNVKGAANKKKFISTIIKLTEKQRITYLEADELDLIYISQWPTYRKWTVYRLLHTKGSMVGVTPEDLQRQMNADLETYRLQSRVMVQCIDEVFWIRIEFRETKTRRPSLNNATYIAFYPSTQYLCISNMKTKYRQFIIQMLTSVLKCRSVDKMDLEGRCIRSLLKIALGRNQQDLPSSLKDKDPQQQTSESSVEVDGRIHDENATEKQQSREFVNSRLGEGPQPTLEFLEYRLETKFAGSEYAPGMSSDEIFRCGVRFEGRNVLEGIKQLVSAGVATVPLPNHLINVKSLARNKILIRSKQK